MTVSAPEYEEALTYLKMKLTLPKKEREQWLNGIVDQWIDRRRMLKRGADARN